MKQHSYLENIGVFLTALSLFMFEVVLTRLFSTLMWYHFVFIATSLAMLGGTIGSILAFQWHKNHRRLSPEKLAARKTLVLGLLSLVLAGTILILYKVPFASSLFPFYIVLTALPFILGGYYLSLVFQASAAKSNILYFADLLGAALGSVIIILLLDKFSLIRIGAFLGLIPLLAASISLNGRKKIAGVAVAGLLVLTLLSGGILDAWAQNYGAYLGNPKLLGAFKDSPNIVYTTWNSLARTDVAESKTGPNKIVLVDGGASSEMIPFNGDLQTIDYLKGDLGYFPFAYKENESALLIGPGGGKDLLFAHLGGVHDITAVEINPGTVEAAQALKDFNGNIYGLEGTKVFVGDGRSFVTRDKNKYDVIFLSKVMTQASETLGYALSENYIYTKEAYATYLDHLNPGGTLAFILHNASDLGKASATILQVLEERGIPRDEAASYLTVINSSSSANHGNTIMYPLLMVKTSPFTKAETRELLALTETSNHRIISIANEFELLSAISPPEKSASKYLVTDNYPFFYNPGHSAPPVILLMLMVVTIGGYLLIRPLLTRKSKDMKYFRNYFAYLGLGFMMIEIPLLQKLILLFGHPTLTFSAVIAILLFSAGVGSLLSKILTSRIPLKLVGVSIFAYSVLLLFILPVVISSLQGSSSAYKLAAAFGLLLPLGLMMGIPFPTGLRLAQVQKQGDFIPVFRAVNGWMSVVGSILALATAMTFGYSITMLAGAMVYLILSYHTKSLPI